MNIWRKKADAGLMAVLTVVFASFCFFVSSPASGLTMDQVRGVIEESAQLVFTGKTPSTEQSRNVEDLRQMISAGDISREDMHKMIREQLSKDMQKHEISRHDIGDMLKQAPKLIPSVTSKEFHHMIWEEINGMIDEPVNIKIGTLAPKGTPWVNYPDKKVNPHISKVSGGKINIKVYVGGVMGEDVDILRKMDVGQLDGCGCTALGALKAAPELAILNLPRLFRDTKEVDHIIKKFRREFDAAFGEKGYDCHQLIDTGYFYIWTKNKVSSLDDIKKQKMLTWFGTVETATYDELGIHPTPVSVPEVLTSLSTGLINGNCGPSPWMLGMQAYTQVNYYVTQPLFYSPAAVMYSKKLKDRFRGKNTDAGAGNIIEMLAYEGRTLEREWIDDKLRPFEEKAIKAFEKYGIKPVTLSENDMMTLQAASEKVWGRLAGTLYSRDFLDRVLKELEDYRKK